MKILNSKLDQIEYFPHDYTSVSRLGFRDASNVLVAVVDCGMDLSLNALKKNLWEGSSESLIGIELSNFNEANLKQIHGIDFTEPDSIQVNPVPSLGEPTHGTSVGSIIGARSAEANRLEGVAHSVQMMSLKVFPTEIDQYASAVSHAITFAVDQGACIINCSFFLYSDDAKVNEAFQYAYDRGALVIAAAGNEDAQLVGRTGLPASFDFPNILTVGAIDGELPDHLVAKSNFGEKVHIAAPGGNVEWITDTGKVVPVYVSTSHAAAYVSGASALVWNRMISKGYGRQDMVSIVKESILEHARCVSPTVPTGLDNQRIKHWGKGNPVLDLSFLV